MQKQTPIKKSAFAPFKPSPSAIQAAREAAKAKAKQQASPSKKEAPPDADAFRDEKGKFEKYFIDKPGSGD